MKKIFVITLTSSLIIFSACKKDSKTVSQTETPSPTIIDNYTSLSDFYSQNGVPKETFTLIAGTGGNFVSAKGTTIEIAANTFTPSNAIIAIEFKDIYSKSDMLLTNMPTNLVGGAPLVSAGEFFIKALNNNIAVDIAAGKKIDVFQSSLVSIPIMTPFVAIIDTAATKLNQQSTNNLAWQPNSDTISFTKTRGYRYSFYKFYPPLSNGTWFNSDNSSFFSSYSQTTLTIHPNQTGFILDVFLVYKVNAMIFTNKETNNNYLNYHSPIGLECTVVAVAIKNGKLYSSFTPIKISANQTVNIDMSETTAENFKTALKALN